MSGRQLVAVCGHITVLVCDCASCLMIAEMGKEDKKMTTTCVKKIWGSNTVHHSTIDHICHVLCIVYTSLYMLIVVTQPCIHEFKKITLFLFYIHSY